MNECFFQRTRYANRPPTALKHPNHCKKPNHAIHTLRRNLINPLDDLFSNRRRLGRSLHHDRLHLGHSFFDDFFGTFLDIACDRVTCCSGGRLHDLTVGVSGLALPASFEQFAQFEGGEGVGFCVEDYFV